jgi:CRP/FNR family cyclic AMP-dependent transcriptional regulator
MDALALLARSPLFAGVSTDQLEPLARSLRPRRYPRGGRLFSEGDPGTHLLVIVSGQVKISRIAPGGEELVYAVLGEGDVFGELALFDDEGRRTTDAEATEPTECLSLERSVLLDAVAERPEMLRRIIAVLSGYIRRKDGDFAEVAFLDIPGRVAQKLLDLTQTYGRAVPGGTRITLRMPQRTLAGMVGASRENVSRALARFASEGVIAQEAGYITVLRPDVLRRRAV